MDRIDTGLDQRADFFKDFPSAYGSGTSSATDDSHQLRPAVCLVGRKHASTLIEVA
jgi:hypothetical protein